MRAEHELSHSLSQEWTHSLVKVRRYRPARTPIGAKIRKAVEARRAWSLTLSSYSEKRVAMILAAWWEAKPMLLGDRNEGRKPQGATRKGERKQAENRVHMSSGFAMSWRCCMH